MTPLQLLFYVALPLAVGVVGVAYAEVARWQAIKEPTEKRAEPDTKESNPFALYFSGHGQLDDDFVKVLWSKVIKPKIEFSQKLAEIDTAFGATRVSTLRQIYGPAFAEGHSDAELLRDLIHQQDAMLWFQVYVDFERGRLSELIRRVRVA